MDKIELVFAWAVTVLAAAATVGALVLALIWECFAIRGVIRRHRRPTHQEALWAEHATMTHPVARDHR